MMDPKMDTDKIECISTYVPGKLQFFPTINHRTSDCQISINQHWFLSSEWICHFEYYAL